MEKVGYKEIQQSESVLEQIQKNQLRPSKEKELTIIKPPKFSSKQALINPDTIDLLISKFSDLAPDKIKSHILRQCLQWDVSLNLQNEFHFKIWGKDIQPIKLSNQVPYFKFGKKRMCNNIVNFRMLKFFRFMEISELEKFPLLKMKYCSTLRIFTRKPAKMKDSRRERREPKIQNLGIKLDRVSWTKTISRFEFTGTGQQPYLFDIKQLKSFKAKKIHIGEWITSINILPASLIACSKVIYLDRRMISDGEAMFLVNSCHQLQILNFKFTFAQEAELTGVRKLLELISRQKSLKGLEISLLARQSITISNFYDYIQMIPPVLSLTLDLRFQTAQGKFQAIEKILSSQHELRSLTLRNIDLVKGEQFSLSKFFEALPKGIRKLRIDEVPSQNKAEILNSIQILSKLQDLKILQLDFKQKNIIQEKNEQLEIDEAIKNGLHKIHNLQFIYKQEEQIPQQTETELFPSDFLFLQKLQTHKNPLEMIISELPKFLQQEKGFPSVYIGYYHYPYTKDPSRRKLVYVGASDNQKIMLEKQLERTEGVTWRAFQSIGTRRDEENNLQLKFPECYYLPDVNQEPKIVFFNKKDKGAFLVVPMVYKSCFFKGSLEEAIKERLRVRKVLIEQTKEYIEILKQIEELGGEEGDYGSEDDIYDYICSRDSFEWETEKSYFYFYKYYAICIDTLGTGSQIEAKDQKYVINLVRECIKILEEYEVNMITQEIDANVGSNKKYAHKDMFERICNE